MLKGCETHLRHSSAKSLVCSHVDRILVENSNKIKKAGHPEYKEPLCTFLALKIPTICAVFSFIFSHLVRDGTQNVQTWICPFIILFSTDIRSNLCELFILFPFQKSGFSADRAPEPGPCWTSHTLSHMKLRNFSPVFLGLSALFFPLDLS